MHSKLFGLIAGMGILAGGVIVVTNLGGKGDVKPIGDAGVGIERLAPTEAEVVDRAVLASNNKLVHIVGVDVPKDSVVGDTSIGRAVVVSEVKENSECSVVFEAKEVTETISDGRGSMKVTHVNLDMKKFPRGTFVKVGGIDKAKGTFIWNALLTGQSCKDIALEPGYLGSSMQELLALSEAMKARVLRTFGNCEEKGKDGKPTGKTYRCDVAYGDARATVGEEIFFPHSFSQRTDLHIMPKKNAEVQKRYQTPDGGFREVTAEPVKEIK